MTTKATPPYTPAWLWLIISIGFFSEAAFVFLQWDLFLAPLGFVSVIGGACALKIAYEGGL